MQQPNKIKGINSVQLARVNFAPNKYMTCVLLWMHATIAGADGHDHFSGHEVLERSSSLEFATVFEAALRNAPEAHSIDSRQQQVEAYQQIGDRWITGRPSWELNYIGDSLLEKVGMREYEAGVQIDLWRRGERDDAKTLGDSYNERLEAWFDYIELLVAGRVRVTLADMTEADAMLELERAASVESERLLDVTRRLFEAGSVAQLDTLRVESLLLDQQEAELQAEARLIDSERDFVQLTGLPARPDREYEESLSVVDDIAITHPTIWFLKTGIDLASARVERVRHEANGNPSVSFGVRRERGNNLLPYVDSLGVSVSVPFGGRAVVSAAVSDARTDKTEAEVVLLHTQRELNAQLHEVEHQLFLVGESLELGERQLEIDEQRHQMAILAFENGEADLSQVIIAMQQASDSVKELKRLQLYRQRLVSEFNQVTGVLP